LIDSPDDAAVAFCQIGREHSGPAADVQHPPLRQVAGGYESIGQIVVIVAGSKCVVPLGDPGSELRCR
jgi:hypothetical protein